MVSKNSRNTRRSPSNMQWCGSGYNLEFVYPTGMDDDILGARQVIVQCRWRYSVNNPHSLPCGRLNSSLDSMNGC